MQRAKVTSKGQVTIPIEVRRALGIDEGDFLAFEMKSGYLTVSRQASLHEVSDAIRESTRGNTSTYATDDEAILSAFDGVADLATDERLLVVRPTDKDLA